MNLFLRHIAPLILLTLIASPLQANDGAPNSQIAPYPYLPPNVEGHVLLYHTFEGEADQPDIAPDGVRVESPDGKPADGLTGRGLAFEPGAGQGDVALRHKAFTVERPMTAMMWFRLPKPMTDTDGFKLVSLHGPKGHIVNYVRGKGKWRRLKRPTFLCRVWGFEGLVDAQPYGGGSGRVAHGQWHHVALTVAAGAEVRVYWDGVERFRYAVKRRRFTADDIHTVVFGPGRSPVSMTIDEAVVLSKALSRDEIVRYIEAVRRLREIGYPVVVDNE